MYRVELKGFAMSNKKKEEGVPNVPCGVERHINAGVFLCSSQFLMYRVELKGVK